MRCIHQEPKEGVLCSHSELHDSTGPLSFHLPHHSSIMCETAQPTTKTDAQSFIQVRHRLRRRIDFIAYSQIKRLSTLYPFLPSVINYTRSGMTGILITIQGISQCWVIDGPDEENVDVSESHVFWCLNKATW
jgi:hypothetical protein